jgi:hypothetical protein
LNGEQMKMPQYHSPKEYLEEARSPTTGADRLDILARTQWEFVRAAVAAHPRVSDETLRRLTPQGTNSWDDGIALAIARRPDASVDALRQMVKRFFAMANRTGRPKDTFELGLALMANPSTPYDAIAELTDPKRTTTHFRLRAAGFVRNPLALERLRDDVSERVRRKLVKTEEIK